MPRHPGEYARMLTERLAAQDVTVWLVNTGWTGGPVGTGERMNIAHTRAMVRAALDGSLAAVETRVDPVFGVEVPLTCPDVPESFLDPRSTWADMDSYDRQAAALAGMFVANFAAYADGVTADIRAAGPLVSDPSAGLGLVSDPGAG
jgi:phosphoenolpyruvate carboxykinase (ATP)